MSCIMRILYLFRPISAGFSIAKVFREVVETIPGATRMEVPAYGGSPSVLLRNLRFVRRLRKDYDIYHITGDITYCALALPGRRTVLTMHDMNLLEYYKAQGLKGWLLRLLWYYLPMKRAAVVTCISEKTCQELVNYYPWVEKKTVVIGNPYDSAMTYVPKPFPGDKPVILHIGTRPNKNLDRVIQAVKDIPCHLRIIGEPGGSQREIIESFGLDYSIAVGLTDAQIVEEYRSADIVSFPSLYEGFGLPIIEGFATGRVVVTSQLEPMLSVAGGAAILVDPESVESIKEGFLLAIHNEPLRNSLIVKGLEVVRSYSVESVSRQFDGLYKKLIQV